VSTRLTDEEIEEQTETIDYELDGKIFAIYRSEEGKEIFREELDGELILKLMAEVLSDAAEHYLTPEVIGMLEDSIIS